MAIEIDGKVYRNLQQQVQKNMDDIQDIKEAMPYPSNEYYNKTEADTKFQDKLTTSDSIIINSETKEISVDEDWLSTKCYTQTVSDGRYARKLYKHDILLSLVDSESHYAGAHIIIIDQYDEAYDYSKVRADWRGNIRPISYYRKQGDSVLTSENDKVYISFYLDNDDEIWFEENETFYSGSAVVTESVNSYQVMGVDDTVALL